jgi:hypothetical protein
MKGIYGDRKPGGLSRYSDWLRDGRPRGRSSSPGRVKNFFTSAAPSSILRPTKLSPLVRGVKRQGRQADQSPPTSAEIKKT